MTSIAPQTAGSEAFLYVESDVPPGMTLSAWRAERTRAARGARSRTRRALRRLTF